MSLDVRPLARSLFLTTAVTVAGAALSTASAAPQVWGEQVGANPTDVLYGVTGDGAGGSYECGAFQGDMAGPSITPGDAFLTRRDALGNVLWTKLVATGGDDGGASVAMDAAGGVFLAGVKDGVLDVHWSDNYDVFVARFDGAGNLLWLVEPGIADYEHVSSCAPDGAGGVFVAGRTYRDETFAAFQDADAWILRIDASGNLLWLDQFGTAVSDPVTRVAADGNGGALLCGSTAGALGGPLAGTYDSWFARYDGAGNQLALQQFGLGGGESSASGIVADGAGGFFLGGRLGNVAFVSRFDAHDNLLWQVPSGLGIVRDLDGDGQGGVYALGSTLDDFMVTNAGLSDPWIRRFDASGAVVQSSYFGSKGFDQGSDIALSGSGVLAGGISNGALFGPSASGMKGWVGRFEDCDFDKVANHCASAPNSTGKAALIGHLGSMRVSNNDFALFAKDCPVAEIGVFLLATSQNSVPFGNGTLCVGGTVQRLGVTSTANGVATKALDFTDAGSPASQITAGSTWHFQFWYRDTAGGGAGFNLTNGLTATFCP